MSRWETEPIRRVELDRKVILSIYTLVCKDDIDTLIEAVFVVLNVLFVASTSINNGNH